MRVFLALLVGIVVGAGALWFYNTKEGRSGVQATGEQIENAAKSTRDTIQEKFRVLDLRPEQVRDDLARTGQVVRRKAREAGQAIADSTADARITAAIKTKLV